MFRQNIVERMLADFLMIMERNLFTFIEIKLPINGLWVIPFIILFLLWKKWFELKLLVFSFPLATTSILFYSGGDNTFNSIFHLFFVALLLSWIVELFFIKFKNKPNLKNA